VLIHALLEGGAVSLGVRADDGGAGSGSVSGGGGGGSGDGGGNGTDDASEGAKCGGRGMQLGAVLLTLVPFGLAAAASLALGHSSEVGEGKRVVVGTSCLPQSWPCRARAARSCQVPVNPAFTFSPPPQADRHLLPPPPSHIPSPTGPPRAAAAHRAAACCRRHRVCTHAALPAPAPAGAGLLLPCAGRGRRGRDDRWEGRGG
jgi:hypothetical protein